MKYIIHGVIEQQVSIEIEAAVAEEAIEIARDTSHRDWDVWDTNLRITGGTATF